MYYPGIFLTLKWHTYFHSVFYRNSAIDTYTYQLSTVMHVFLRNLGSSETIGDQYHRTQSSHEKAPRIQYMMRRIHADSANRAATNEGMCVGQDRSGLVMRFT